MTDLQKDLAIYQAMCKVAKKLFDREIESENGVFRKLMEQKQSITFKEIVKDWRSTFDSFGYANYKDEPNETIEVGTFKCKFPEKRVWDLLPKFKSLAKVKEELVFTYDEEIKNEYAGSVEVVFENPQNAKNLANYTAQDELRPVMNFVLMEVNMASKITNFVASSGALLGVISDNPSRIRLSPENLDTNFQGLFSRKDWERICDYAKKTKGAVKFHVYRANEQEWTDTIVAELGNVKVKSGGQDLRFPNWRSVLPSEDNMTKLTICKDDLKEAYKFVKNLKKVRMISKGVLVSAYKGSDLVYFDCISNDFGNSMSATFRLEKPSEKTIGTSYNAETLLKTKFAGFSIEESDKPTIVDDSATDLTLLCPRLECDYAPYAHEREVGAKIVQMVAA